MKIIILILTIFGITFSYNVLGQSTFNVETLKNAIESYVKLHNPNISKIEIKQTLTPQKFSQKGVVANISHTNDLIGNCKLVLTFSYNEQKLTDLNVKINAINNNLGQSNISTKQVNSFNQIHINKGEKVKLLHYSGVICIRTEGIAMEDGNTGDIIKVVKTDNNQTLYGFIAEDGNIIIEDKNLLVNKGNNKIRK